MKTKALSFILLFCFLAGANCFAADDLFNGTWKLNRKKSSLVKHTPRNDTVKYEDAFPFRTKVTTDGVDGSGRRSHSEWVGWFDGREYEVTGDPSQDGRVYQQLDDHNMNFWIKKGGQVLGSGKIVISADGKTRTVTTVTKNAKGKTYRSRAFYNKVG